jgi:sigma-B regulation protein RsbU (phosphoserine phosphatase)
MDHSRPKLALAWVRRNGVALSVLLGLVLIGLFALMQSGVAILAVARFGASFDEIANADLPNLIAASRLSELSQSLVATAPELSGAGSQIRRHAIADDLNERLTALTSAIDRINPTATNPDQLRAVQAELKALATNLDGLGDFVRQRIDAGDALETVMARLPDLAARVRRVADETLSTATGTGSPTAVQDRSRLIAWSAAGLEGITLMLATPSVRAAWQLERIKAEFAAIASSMNSLRDGMSEPIRSKIDGFHAAIAQFGLGTPNPFDARRVQIEADTATQTSLRLIEQRSDRFIASVSAILRTTQEKVDGRSAYFSRMISYFNLLIAATLLLSVAAGTAIFLYVRRAVITRLRAVQDYMRAEVEGRSAAIATDGADEIAEIAKATQIFVTRIAESERRTRTRMSELDALGKISQAVNSTLDLDRVLSTVVAKATELSGSEAGAIYVFDETSQEFKLRATCGMDETTIAAISARPIRRGETAVGEAAEKGEPIQISDVHNDRSKLVLDVIVQAGFRALLIVPLLSADRIVGALVVRRKTPGEFTKSTADLLQTLAAQSVLAISNARLFSENEKSLRRLSRELDAARKLQLAMLPREFPDYSPEQPVDMHAFIEPAREVGGDLYDCFYAADHLCCFLVGDVAGKGAPAAMFMARTSSLVRMAVTLWHQMGAEITTVRIAEIVNRELCQNNHEDMFVTVFLGLLDTRTGVVNHVNAGHPSPHILRASGELVPIVGKSDLPLGLHNAAVFHGHAVTLRPGDLIFAFSDGIIEATNERGVLYGHARLQAQLRAAGSNVTPAELVRAVTESVQTFTGAAPKSDDVTALALRWLPA